MERKLILIVEDEPFVAEVILAALQDSHTVQWAADAPGALAYLARHRPDMVLLDCLLPGGHLTEVLAKAGVLGIAVVLMSGHPDVLGQFVAFGYPCLSKPFELDALLQAVDRTARSRWSEMLAG